MKMNRELEEMGFIFIPRNEEEDFVTFHNEFF